MRVEPQNKSFQFERHNFISCLFNLKSHTLMPLFIVLQNKEINSPEIEMSMKLAGQEHS